jgi:hypothetical protein
MFSAKHCIESEKMHLRKIYPQLKLEEDVWIQSALAK